MFPMYSRTRVVFIIRSLLITLLRSAMAPKRARTAAAAARPASNELSRATL